jgi:RimJ/RimL family protein N-acetyltransferase
MNIPTIYASAHIQNVGSRRILEKIGLRDFEYNHDGIPCVWYELDKINYQNENNKIAGVPEHFNLPWHLAIEKKAI